MFVGRQREMKKLEKLYRGNQFEFVVFYGRRRVGKTTLINEFLADKKSSYYMSVEGTKAENLSGLSRALLTLENQGLLMPEFRDFESLLGYIDQLARSGERRIIAIDEYPYLAASYPAISSMLQSHIDQCWKDSSLFLILCGSSMSFMEEQVLGYKSPLYGRRTAQFKIHPFTFFEAKEMLPGFESREQAVLYGATGGLPEYLSRIQPGYSVDDNLMELFFDESGRLFEEPSNLLKQELKEPATYHSILSAIAGGASRLNEIATKTGLESSGCSNQLASLMTLEIVKKEFPITEKAGGRKTLYRLGDSMFLFWYRFVRPNLSTIIRGMGETVYETLVKPQLNDFMGSIFEEICQQYMFRPTVYGALPFPIGNLGRWWGNNPKKKCQEEIDLMAVLEEKAFFGECKWRNEQVDTDVLHTLEERGKLFHYEKEYFWVFAKEGFTPDAVAYAEKKENIRLLSFDEMNG